MLARAARPRVCASTEFFSRKFRKPALGDFRFFRKHPRHVQLCQHIRRQLARIQLSRLGQGHQGVALVIAKFGIGARAHEDGGGIRIRQNGADGGLQGGFDFFMR